MMFDMMKTAISMSILILSFVGASAPTTAQEITVPPPGLVLNDYSANEIVVQDVSGVEHSGAKAYRAMGEPEVAEIYEQRLRRKKAFLSTGLIMTAVGAAAVIYGATNPERTHTSSSSSLGGSYPIYSPRFSSQTTRLPNPFARPAKMMGSMIAAAGAIGVTASLALSAIPVSAADVRLHLARQ